MISWSTSDIAGIEFGDTHVTCMRLTGKTSLTVTHAGWVDYDAGAAPAVVAKAVKSLWKQSGIPTRTVCASLRSASMVVRHFSMPTLTAKDLANALSLQAEEALQLPRDQFVLEWHVHRCGTVGPGGEPITGIFAAAPVKDVERELEILNLAGLDPVIIDVRALAAVNLYSVLQPVAAGASVCLVSLSPHSADVMVRSGNGELYPYTVYCRASTWAETPSFLADNVRDVLKYCEYKLGWEAANRVVVMGESAGKDALVASLTGALEISVEFWNPLDEIKIKSTGVEKLLSGKTELGGCLAPVMGLALRRS